MKDLPGLRWDEEKQRYFAIRPDSKPSGSHRSEPQENRSAGSSRQRKKARRLADGLCHVSLGQEVSDSQAGSRSALRPGPSLPQSSELSAPGAPHPAKPPPSAAASLPTLLFAREAGAGCWAPCATWRPEDAGPGFALSSRACLRDEGWGRRALTVGSFQRRCTEMQFKGVRQLGAAAAVQADGGLAAVEVQSGGGGGHTLLLAGGRASRSVCLYSLRHPPGPAPQTLALPALHLLAAQHTASQNTAIRILGAGAGCGAGGEGGAGERVPLMAACAWLGGAGTHGHMSLHRLPEDGAPEADFRQTRVRRTLGGGPAGAEDRGPAAVGGEALAVVQRHSVSGSLWAIEVDAACSLVAMGTSSGTAVLDIETNRVQRVFSAQSDVLSLAMHPSGELLVCGHRNGSVTVADRRAPRAWTVRAPPLPAQGPSRARAAAGKGRGKGKGEGKGKGRSQPWRGNRSPALVAGSTAVCSLLPLPWDSSAVVVSHIDSSLHRFDLRKPASVLHFEGHVNSHSMLDLAVDASGQVLLAGGEDCHVRAWSLATGAPAASFGPLPGPPSTLCTHPLLSPARHASRGDHPACSWRPIWLGTDSGLVVAGIPHLPWAEQQPVTESPADYLFTRADALHSD